MPRLLRAIGRTAAIAGTATVVSGRVQRRQARRFAGSDTAAPAPAPEEDAQEQPAPGAVPAPRAATSTADTLAELQSLGELKAQGVLTEDEFALQKTKILGE
jgi:putative oligomerization/nucleic acid binding protein